MTTLNNGQMPGRNTYENTTSADTHEAYLKQPNAEARLKKTVDLQVKHSRLAHHEDSKWSQINMATVAPVRPVEGSVDGGNGSLISTNVDASVYAEAFASSMYDSLNDPEFIDHLNEELTAEIRPFRTEPTPIHLPLLADNSVRFNPNNRYTNADKPTTTVKFGQMVTVDKAIDAVAFNHSVELYDFTMETSGFTEASLEHAVRQALVDVCTAMSSHAVAMLVDAKLTNPVTVEKPSGKPKDQAEDVVDLLAMNVTPAYGESVSDYTVLVHSSLKAILDRAAQRAGVQDISEYLGCGVEVYKGDDHGIFMLPRRFTMLSFRSTKDDIAFPVTMTRVANKQAWVIEMRGCMDLLASGTARDADGEEVSLPMITQLVWKTEDTGGVES